MKLLPLVFATHVAAGGVVDVSAGAEARGTQMASPDGDLASGALAGAFVLRPALAGALEEETRAARASYAPQLSFVSPASQLFLVLHTADASGEMALHPRLRLRGGLSGALGELDPMNAQGALQRSSALFAPLVAMPYAMGAARLGADARLARTVALDTDVRIDTQQSPGAETLPASSGAALDATLAWQIARMDGLLFGVRGRTAGIDGRGSYNGGAAVAGWRRQIGARAGFDLLGGAGPYFVEATGGGSALVWVPTGEARLRGVFDLAGEAALELSALGSLGAVADPLGALLENRAALAAGALYRLTRELAVRAEVGGFGPVFTVGQPATAIATTSLTSTAGIAWALSPNLALEGGLLGTTRLIDDRALTDVTVSVALVGNATVFHTGARPRGSDPNPGRRLGAEPIGAPPPPNRPLGAEDPSPLPEPLEVEVPPPELQPPPGYIDDDLPPPALGPSLPARKNDRSRREREEAERREAAEKAKKNGSGSGSAGEGAEGKKDDGKKKGGKKGKGKEKDDGKDEAAPAPASRGLVDTAT
jgi:hypothetical protein